MTQAHVLPTQAAIKKIAIFDNPNCGKTALFNLLTGARQKVANYAGVTVERKVGRARLRNGQTFSVVDLPGSCSLTPATPDEQVMLDVIEGRRAGEDAPDVIVAVVDATNLPMDAIKGAMAHMAEGPLRSLLMDGVIAGVGGVLVFLPQILILFFFILLLEDSGYLPRAAFLLDNLIGAFVPERDVGWFSLRSLTLFGLYVAGVVSAMGVAWIFKRVWMKSGYQPLMLELPPYRVPSLRNLGLGLWERARIFLRRVGGIIFALMVILWFLSTYPGPPAGWDISQGPAIRYSAAGILGHALQVVFAPQCLSTLAWCAARPTPGATRCS